MISVCYEQRLSPYRGRHFDLNVYEKADRGVGGWPGSSVLRLRQCVCLRASHLDKGGVDGVGDDTDVRHDWVGALGTWHSLRALTRSHSHSSEVQLFRAQLMRVCVPLPGRITMKVCMEV